MKRYFEPKDSTSYFIEYDTVLKTYTGWDIANNVQFVSEIYADLVKKGKVRLLATDKAIDKLPYPKYLRPIQQKSSILFVIMKSLAHYEIYSVKGQMIIRAALESHCYPITEEQAKRLLLTLV